jgi:hypothetical protein
MLYTFASAVSPLPSLAIHGLAAVELLEDSVGPTTELLRLSALRGGRRALWVLSRTRVPSSAPLLCRSNPFVLPFRVDSSFYSKGLSLGITLIAVGGVPGSGKEDGSFLRSFASADERKSTTTKVTRHNGCVVSGSATPYIYCRKVTMRRNTVAQNAHA